MTDKNDTDPKRKGRHSNGRWKKGHCPNRLGRGRAKANQQLELARSIQEYTSDIFEFARTVVEMTINGKTVYMTREAAVLYKRYECALKGSVTAKRDILKDIHKNREMAANLRKHYEDMLLYWHVEHPRANDPDFEIPPHVQLELMQLQSLLSELYPHYYKKPE